MTDLIVGVITLPQYEGLCPGGQAGGETEVLVLDLPGLGEVPLLVAPGAVAGVEADRPPSTEVTQGVQALRALPQ